MEDSREGAFDLSMDAYHNLNSEYDGVEMNEIPESVEYGSEVDVGNLRGYLDQPMPKNLDLSPDYPRNN